MCFRLHLELGEEGGLSLQSILLEWVMMWKLLQQKEIKNKPPRIIEKIAIPFKLQGIKLRNFTKKPWWWKWQKYKLHTSDKSDTNYVWV